MNIIQANKYYYERGGADIYALALSRLLERHGHVVVPFAMEQTKNKKTPWDRFFPSYVQTEVPGFSIKGLKTFGRMLYSQEAKRKMARLIEEARPDVCHVHNIYTQLSPSVLSALKRKNVPTVMTVHDYHLIAPNYMLWSHGKIEDWGRAGLIRATLSKFHKDSLAASFAQALTFKLHRWFKLYEHGVQYFITPSEFVRGKMIEGGFNEDRVITVPHFFDVKDKEVTNQDDGYFLYFGRLVPEKGVDVLIRAMEKLPDVKCKIVGSGPDKERLKEWARGMDNVEFAGWKREDQLWDLVRRARAVVVPSVWNEVFGLVAIEAMAFQKAVIASDIGGLPEVVEDGVTGRLFPPGDVQALRAIISDFVAHPKIASEYGYAGRKKVESEYDPEKHYARIMEVYDQAIAERK